MRADKDGVYRAALVSVLCIGLAGCGGTGVRSDAFSESGSDRAEAQANVRAAIPATEAYYADNGSYAGITLEKLRTTYDSSLEDVRFVVANAKTYCVQSTAGAETYSKAGPAADITSGAC